MNKRTLNIALLATLSVVASHGMSFGRDINYTNYGAGRLYRTELYDFDADDAEEDICYNPHLENSKRGLYEYCAKGAVFFGLFKLLTSALNNTPGGIGDRLQYAHNANMISFADEKKEINKISLINIGNTCYINTFIQPVLQFPRLIELIKGVDVKTIRERLHDEKKCNFLTGVHQLVIKIAEDKKVSYDDWKHCAKLMGHSGNTGTANDFWEKLLDTIKEYYGYYWGEDKYGNKIYCPSKSITEIVLDATVFNEPLDVGKKIIDEMKKEYLSEDKKLFRNSLRASFGIIRVTIPSYLELLEERNGKKLQGLENTFEKFTINKNGNQEIWTDYDKKVEQAEANLKAITINYPGHWIAYTRHDNGYYKHNDESISKVSKEFVMKEIINNPIGTTLIYSIS